MTFNRGWFKGSVNVRTPFGWDARFNRIHPFQDYAPLDGKREETIAHTIIDGKVSWHIDGQGNSILRQVGSGVEIRYYHMRREELSSDIIAAFTVPGTVVKAGTAIGPAGNVGIAVPGKGNDGSHIHLGIVTHNAPGWFGLGWDDDDSEALAQKYGDAFTLKVHEWRVEWMNEKVVYRFDPTTQRLAYFLNPRIILEG